MPLDELTESNIQRLAETAFSIEGLKELADLQRVFRDNIAVVSPDTPVLSEEFGYWDDSKLWVVCLG